MSRSDVGVALAACLAWAVLIVACRVVLLGTGVNAWAFTLVQLIAGGATLMALAWRGQIAWRALLMGSTWVYGLLRVIASACASAALIYVGVMQDTLLAMINVPLAALVLLVWDGRAPRGWAWAGHGLIVVGILVLALNLPGGLLNPAVILELIAESAVALSTVLIERHPHNRTESIADRAMFTGIVLLVTAFSLSIAWLFMAGTGLTIGQGNLALGQWGAAFGGGALWLWGGLIGAFMRGPTMYLALWAIKRAGTVTYLATLALLPLAGLAFEWIAAQAALLPHPSLALSDAVATAIIIAGALLLVRYRAAPPAEDLRART